MRTGRPRGRPKFVDRGKVKEIISFRIEKEEKEKLVRLAMGQDMTVSEMVHDWVMEILADGQ